jgi:hypothetical protein
MVKLAQHGVQSEMVALRTEAADYAFSDIGKIGMAAKLFSGVHIGQMHFYKGNFNPKQGIPQCDTGVSKGAGVDDNKVNPFLLGIVNALNKFIFSIALQGE